MTLTASSSSRAVTNSLWLLPLIIIIVMPRWPLSTSRPTRLSSEGRQRDVYIVWAKFVRELQQRGFDIFLDLKFHISPTLQRTLSLLQLT